MSKAHIYGYALARAIGPVLGIEMIRGRHYPFNGKGLDKNEKK